MGDKHTTGCHFGGDTHITSDMCAEIHISRGYTITMTPVVSNSPAFVERFFKAPFS